MHASMDLDQFLCTKLRCKVRKMTLLFGICSLLSINLTKCCEIIGRLSPFQHRIYLTYFRAYSFAVGAATRKAAETETKHLQIQSSSTGICLHRYLLNSCVYCNEREGKGRGGDRDRQTGRDGDGWSETLIHISIFPS